MLTRSTIPAFLLLLVSASPMGCSDVGGSIDPPEVITTVALSFAPMGGGATVTAEFDDPDGDGGAAPTVDPITLPEGLTYTLTVSFQNRLEDPAEEITDEVRDEAEDHQVFFTGDAVDGPAADNPLAPLVHTYADSDGNGLPIGLTSTIVTASGTGELTVTLRHLPPIDDMAVKVADLASQVRDGGLESIGGESDVHVTFTVTAGAPAPGA
jgi:hypothetical protein